MDEGRASQKRVRFDEGPEEAQLGGETLAKREILYFFEKFQALNFYYR